MTRLARETYDRIDKEVYAIHMDYNVTSFPVDEKWLAGEMRFRLIPYSALEKSKRERLLNTAPTGFHILDKGSGDPKIYIAYNDYEEPGRQKLTIFHEIAHIVLGHGSNPTKEQEAEAEYFAKQLAAPRAFLRFRGHMTPIEIHDNYGLSWEASEYSANAVWNAFERYGDEVLENDREYIQWVRGWSPS